jgi:hypothetical protein
MTFTLNLHLGLSRKVFQPYSFCSFSTPLTLWYAADCCDEGLHNGGWAVLGHDSKHSCLLSRRIAIAIPARRHHMLFLRWQASAYGIEFRLHFQFAAHFLEKLAEAKSFGQEPTDMTCANNAKMNKGGWLTKLVFGFFYLSLSDIDMKGVIAYS